MRDWVHTTRSQPAKATRRRLEEFASNEITAPRSRLKSRLQPRLAAPLGDYNVSMRTTPFIALLALVIPCAMADEAAKNAKIEEMLVLTKADALIHQVFEQMKGMRKIVASVVTAALQTQTLLTPDNTRVHLRP